MYNHAPQNYTCPLCLAINGIESPATMMKQADIVYRDELVISAINSKFFTNNPGHLIIFPKQHYENVYDIPEEVAHHIMSVSKKIALALKKSRKCDGVTIWQNNEPASSQHAFHYHMHVIPRFNDDQFEKNVMQTYIATPEERKTYSTAMKNFLN